MTPGMAVIGSTNVDLLLRVSRHPAPGETLLGRGGTRSPGGKGGNQALAAALQGAAVRFFGAVGADGDADLALSRLREAGVDTSAVAVRAGEPTGLAVITVADDGENSIVVVPGANGTVTADDVAAWARTLGDVGLVLLQGELPRETTEAAVAAAATAGRRVVLNLAPWHPVDPDLLRRVEVLVLNQQEAEAVTAMLGLPAQDDPQQQASALVRHGVPAVVITLGARGAVLADGAGARGLPAAEVDAVDTTGAGDAFTGALAARLLAGDDLDTAAERAGRVAAYSVQRPGAQTSYPAGHEVETGQ